MKTKFTKEEILTFTVNDWKFELSSGYDGYRNINEQSKYYMDWIYMNKYDELQRIQKEYNKDFIFLKNFSNFTNNIISDEIINNFLDFQYFNI